MCVAQLIDPFAIRFGGIQQATQLVRARCTVARAEVTWAPPLAKVSGLQCRVRSRSGTGPPRWNTWRPVAREGRMAAEKGVGLVPVNLVGYRGPCPRSGRSGATRTPGTRSAIPEPVSSRCTARLLPATSYQPLQVEVRDLAQSGETNLDVRGGGVWTTVPEAAPDLRNREALLQQARANAWRRACAPRRWQSIPHSCMRLRTILGIAEWPSGRAGALDERKTSRTSVCGRASRRYRAMAFPTWRDSGNMSVRPDFGRWMRSVAASQSTSSSRPRASPARRPYTESASRIARSRRSVGRSLAVVAIRCRKSSADGPAGNVACL